MARLRYVVTCVVLNPTDMGVGVKLEQQLLMLRRMQDESPILRFFRSQSVDTTGAFLLTYFSGESRRIPVEELHEHINADRDALAFHDGKITLPKAATLTAQWVDRGLLARRQDSQSRAEFFELTRAGADIVDFLQSLDRPLAKATQSRLANLTQMLVTLEMETNPDLGQRIEALEKRRAEIDRQIERIRAGHIEITPEWRVKENLSDIINLAKEVPLDFLRVRDEFDSINRTLRRDLLESSQPQEETLTEVFLGIDHVQSSEAGRSFDAFYEMLLDEERRVSFDAAVEALAQRGYLDELSAEDVYLIEDYSVALQRGAMPVREVMTTLSRNLRQFVQSRQFQRYRAMMERLNEIQCIGLEASQWLRPIDVVPGDLQLSTACLGSVARLALRYPSDERTDEPIVVAEAEALNVDALRDRIRESEIDFIELVDNINAAIEQSVDPVDFARIFDLYPPTQGLASIVGILALGMRHGESTGETVTLRWQGNDDGVWRVGRVSNYVFSSTIGGSND